VWTLPVPNFTQMGGNLENENTISVTLQAKYVFHHTVFHKTLSIKSIEWGFSIQKFVKVGQKM
jgi:hypothetical protein